MKGPLATASTAIDELVRGCCPEDSLAHLELARRSLAKARDLITALPDLLRQPGPNLRRVALEGILEFVRSDVEVDLEACHGTMRVVRPLPQVLGDPTRLRIALRNLIQNALRHRRPNTRPDITIRAWVHAHRCAITISDNGLGLPNRQARAMQHAGAGLTIARRSIESSGGTLAFQARRGFGTTAAVTLHACASRD